MRQELDGVALLGERIRVYFGEHTREDLDKDQHLQAPEAKKLFFISPPPSPPVGWEMRNEAAPNKDVHAEDLASALARLEWKPLGLGDTPADVNADVDVHITAADGTVSPDAMDTGGAVSPITPSVVVENATLGQTPIVRRQRSGSSTLLLVEHEGAPGNPGIMVEDTTAEEPEELEETVDQAVSETAKPALVHTARPPVELMED